jgi:hypothetical protein
MVRANLVCAFVVLCVASAAGAQVSAPDGWVVIPVEEYRALRLRAFPPERPPDPPPVEATITRVEYDLRADGASIAGETRVTVDVLRAGWVRVHVPAGLLVRGARVDGRPVALIDKPAPHVLLATPGRVALALDVVVPVRTNAGAEALTLPATPGAVSRLAIVVPRDGLDVTVDGGVLTERPQAAGGPWIAYGRGGQPLTVTWRRRVESTAEALPLRWRGSVRQVVGLGEETTAVTAIVTAGVVQGTAASIDIGIPEGLSVNQVSGPLVADWDVRGGALRITFLEPIASEASLSITAEARTPRDGTVTIPLLRLPAAERETGGVAVEVLGAGEIGGRDARGVDPADPSDLGDALRGRDSPSLVVFRYRPQEGASPRSLTVTVSRYTPQAVLIANVEEARYDALVGEDGKALVRARFAVRNNQRGFLAVSLPAEATLWSASVADRPIRPGIGPSGALLVPLEKGRAGDETPAFAVEVVYLQRGAAWADRGRGALVLPAIDLPINRAGLVLRHSPKFAITPDPGIFRVGDDVGPVAAVLQIGAGLLAAEGTAIPRSSPPLQAQPAPADELVRRFHDDARARAVVGPLPVRVPFPAVGPSVFLLSELTPESQAPSVVFSYKRETRW